MEEFELDFCSYALRRAGAENL